MYKTNPYPFANTLGTKCFQECLFCSNLLWACLTCTHMQITNCCCSRPVKCICIRYIPVKRDNLRKTLYIPWGRPVHTPGNFQDFMKALAFPKGYTKGPVSLLAVRKTLIYPLGEGQCLTEAKEVVSVQIGGARGNPVVMGDTVK